MFSAFITTAPTYVCLFWCIIFLLEYRQNPTHKRIMFWFMLTAAILYFGHYCYFEHITSMLCVTDTLYLMANLSVYPIYYLYITNVTENRLRRRDIVLALAPAVLIGIAQTATLLTMTPQQRLQFATCSLYGNAAPGGYDSLMLQAIHTVNRIVFALEIVYVVYFSIRKIRNFNQRVANFYSNLTERNLFFTSTLLWFLLVTSVSSIALNVLSRAFFADSKFVLSLPSAAFSLLLLFIGYDAHRRQFSDAVFMVDEAEDDEATTNAPALLCPAYTEQLAERFRRVVEDEQLYLIPDLKMSDVVKRLATNRNYLYQAIAQQIQMSFADYINRQRIECAKRLLRQNPQLPLSEIMIKSGFNSESTFFRNFKKQTGKTPGQWEETALNTTEE